MWCVQQSRKIPETLDCFLYRAIWPSTWSSKYHICNNITPPRNPHVLCIRNNMQPAKPMNKLMTVTQLAVIGVCSNSQDMGSAISRVMFLAIQLPTFLQSFFWHILFSSLNDSTSFLFRLSLLYSSCLQQSQQYDH